MSQYTSHDHFFLEFPLIRKITILIPWAVGLISWSGMSVYKGTVAYHVFLVLLSCAVYFILKKAATV